MNQILNNLNNYWHMAYARHQAYEKNQLKNIKSISDIDASGLSIYNAKVPGNFELDLFENRIIEDPFSGTNVMKLHEYEDCHIWYFLKFKLDTPVNDETYLVFEGLDTYADIYIDGKHIGTTDNMLIEHEFLLEGILDTENELVVHIKPTCIEARKYEYPVSLWASPYNYESLYVRKAPHMFGWDIMPRIVSAGIWKPVRIECRSEQRIEEVYLYTVDISHENKNARITASYKVKIADCYSEDYEICITGKCENGSFKTRNKLHFISGKITFTVDDIKLWWPKDRGMPNLYDVTVELLKRNQVIDTKQFKFGIRTVKLERTSFTDEEGNGEFCFIINNEKVFVKGSNWVPADAFHSRDRERIPDILKLADDIGCNMLRCWGGNVYEDDIFYELCDQYGIMVWQDFSMGCAVYPQDTEFQNRIRSEAESVVKRLRQHPCIVLWAGDNECDQAYQWGGILTDPNQNVITRVVLPEVIKKLDIDRPYIPSSPYIDVEAFVKGWRYLTENHLWGSRDYYKSNYYKTALCHFASEIGYHGCPSPDSLKKFISPEKLWPYRDNDEWLAHATSPKLEKDSIYAYRVDLMANQVRELFGFIPDNLEEFSLASQISQAEAFKFFIELFRTQKWRKTGIIWWNLMDGWPQFSDAVVDYYFNKKLAYSYIKRSQQSVCVMLREPDNWKMQVVASNDSREGMELDFRVMDMDTGITVLERKKYIAADGVTYLGDISFSISDKKFYLITWKSDLCKGINHYLAGMPPFDFNKYVTWMKQMDNM